MGSRDGVKSLYFGNVSPFGDEIEPFLRLFRGTPELALPRLASARASA
jgi:hypothetical protein